LAPWLAGLISFLATLHSLVFATINALTRLSLTTRSFWRMQCRLACGDGDVEDPRPFGPFNCLAKQPECTILRWEWSLRLGPIFFLERTFLLMPRTSKKLLLSRRQALKRRLMASTPSAYALVSFSLAAAASPCRRRGVRSPHDPLK
jgi:hypothetical protein